MLSTLIAPDIVEYLDTGKIAIAVSRASPLDLMKLQALIDKLAERGCAAAARTEPVERLPERLLRLRATREPTHLRSRRTSSFERTWA